MTRQAAHPVTAPAGEDPFVRGAVERAGGPLGRFAAPRTRTGWTPLRVVLLLALAALALGWLQKYPCRNPDNWTDQHQYTWMCYSDVEALYYSEGLNHGAVPYADHPVEYPVLIGAAMGLAELGAHGLADFNNPASADIVGPERFFDLTALLLAGCGLVVVWTTLRLAGRRRPWDAAMVALAPVLLLHAFTNWDLIAAALAGLGLYAWSRGRPLWAGVAIGLGTAAKLYPVLLLGALLLCCLRRRRLRPWSTAVAGGVVAWLVVDLPIWIRYPSAFGRFYADNRSRGADWDSLWYGLQHLIGDFRHDPLFTISTGWLNPLVVVGLLLVFAGVAWVTLTAPTPPRVAQVSFLLLVGFLLVNKVDSPQYVLWLLPLAVLARPRWPLFLAWQASEVWLLFTRFYFFVGNDQPGQGLPIWVFLWSVVVRDALLVALAVNVIREMRRPALDVVRRVEGVDPAAGPLLAPVSG